MTTASLGEAGTFLAGACSTVPPLPGALPLTPAVGDTKLKAPRVDLGCSLHWGLGKWASAWGLREAPLIRAKEWQQPRRPATRSVHRQLQASIPGAKALCQGRGDSMGDARDDIRGRKQAQATEVTGGKGRGHLVHFRRDVPDTNDRVMGQGRRKLRQRKKEDWANVTKTTVEVTASTRDQ